MPQEPHLPRSPLNAVRPPLKTRVTEELPGRPRLVVVRLWWTPHRGEVRPALVLAVSREAVLVEWGDRERKRRTWLSRADVRTRVPMPPGSRP